VAMQSVILFFSKPMDEVNKPVVHCQQK